MKPEDITAALTEPIVLLSIQTLNPLSVGPLLTSRGPQATAFITPEFQGNDQGGSNAISARQGTGTPITHTPRLTLHNNANPHTHIHTMAACESHLCSEAPADIACEAAMVSSVIIDSLTPDMLLSPDIESTIYITTSNGVHQRLLHGLSPNSPEPEWRKTLPATAGRIQAGIDILS